MTQTDVMQTGRVVTDMIASELAQAKASDVNAANFFVRIHSGPFFQTLPPHADGTRRTNVRQDVFFLTCANHQWTAIGYRVWPVGAGAGTLYRFSTNIPSSPSMFLAGRIAGAVKQFVNADPSISPGHFSRIADGVVHFRVRAFGIEYVVINRNGRLELSETNNGTLISRSITNEQGGVSIIARRDNSNPSTGEFTYAFLSNALPMMVELELGVLEPPALERYRALAATPVAANRFLAERPQAVHLYRQLIQIRSSDPEAYKLNLVRYQ